MHRFFARFRRYRGEEKSPLIFTFDTLPLFLLFIISSVPPDGLALAAVGCGKITRYRGYRSITSHLIAVKYRKSLHPPPLHAHPISGIIFPAALFDMYIARGVERFHPPFPNT